MPRRSPPDPRVVQRFHHAAIRLLRWLRKVDEAHGFSGPRASALSVLVFRGPQSLGELAAAEGVKPPTMSRLVKAMVREGLAAAGTASHDERRIRIVATPRGRKRMLRAREHRLDAIAKLMADATADEAAALAKAVELLERSLGRG
jgi:DNA-binding MarR family transcriptional regulator